MRSKRIAAFLLTVLLLCSLSACQVGSQEDPKAGIYQASEASMTGISIPVKEVYPDGFYIEIKDSEHCVITVGENHARGLYAFDPETCAFSCEAGEEVLRGTLRDGVIAIENIMGTGMTMTFVKD